jgi:hypothetical protein
VTYNVYASTTAGFAPSPANRIATGIAGTTYSNTGLSASTVYYYLVTAQNANGESAASNRASATTKAELSCHVAYTVTSQWNVGFGVAITVKNTGSTPISGWNLTWTWPGNQKITQSWNSDYTQNGANATLTNASWNPTIAPGATLSGVGFNGSYSGTNTAPTAFYLNGKLCIEDSAEFQPGRAVTVRTFPPVLFNASVTFRPYNQGMDRRTFIRTTGGLATPPRSVPICCARPPRKSNTSSW